MDMKWCELGLNIQLLLILLSVRPVSLDCQHGHMVAMVVGQITNQFLQQPDLDFINIFRNF